MFYARMGMHVADDGIILAAAKRIFIDGEIPHRDFISLRPVGTFFYWIPSLLFPDNLVNTASRFFVMIQMAFISYSWMALYEHLYRKFLSTFSWVIIITIVYLFCVSTFWLFPLYTTDGVFFASIGIGLIFNRKKSMTYLGYILLGCACLAKQNFAAMIPAVLIATFDFKDVKKSILPFFFSILAPLIYLFWLNSHHALADFQLQLKQYPLIKTFMTAGIFPYLKNKYFYMGIVLGLVSFVRDEKKLKYLRPLVFILLGIHILQNLFLRGYLFRVPIFICGFSFALFLS